MNHKDDSEAYYKGLNINKNSAENTRKQLDNLKSIMAGKVDSDSILRDIYHIEGMLSALIPFISPDDSDCPVLKALESIKFKTEQVTTKFKRYIEE